LPGRGIPIRKQLAYVVSVLLLILLSGCGSPKSADILGEEAKLLAQTKVGDAVVMLGALPSGEWITGIAGDEGTSTQKAVPQLEPTPYLAQGVAVLSGQAPPNAVRYELLTREGLILKGKIEGDVYLIAWPATSDNPGYILRILNESDDEIFRWPPPGGLPAA